MKHAIATEERREVLEKLVLAQLTEKELEELNRARLINRLANIQAGAVWNTLRERYGLPETVEYDTQTGEVRESE